MSSEDQIREMKQRQQEIQRRMEELRNEFDQRQKFSTENYERSEQTGGHIEQQTRKNQRDKEY